MTDSVGRGRVLLLILAAGWFAGSAFAQAPIPAPRPVPTEAPPAAPVPPPPSPPPLLETPPTALAGPSMSPAATAASGHAGRPVDLQPLPGSLPDQMAQEYEARRLFRYCAWTGTRITAFPNSLLWQPPFAIKREPRLQLLPNSRDNPTDTWTLDTSIGNTVGFFRFEPTGQDLAYQLDIFAVVHTRLLPEDLDVADFRFGFPLTARWGSWHAKLAYEHTSSHLGDEFIRRERPNRIPGQARDEIVVGVGRWMGDQLRVYGQVAYAFFKDYPFAQTEGYRYRYDAGFEWFCPAPTGFRGTPFVAANVDVRGDAGYQPGITAQVGWLWRNPYQRLANVRLFAEYTDSRSLYGQFYLNRERFYSFGFSCDY